MRQSPPAAVGTAAERLGFRKAGTPAVASAWLWLLAILAVGLALRIWHLGQESLWLDEADSWRFAQLSQHALWTEPLDTHPPLYYSLLRLWRVFGQSEAALRSLSVVFGALAIGLTYLLGRQMVDERAGLFAAALMATSTLQLQYSQEARSYEMLTAASLVASIGLVGVLQAHEAGRRPRVGSCIAYVGGMVFTLYAHNIALLLFAVAGLIGLADVMRWRRLDGLAVWAALNGLVLAGWRYWLPVVWKQGTGKLPQLNWLHPPDLHAVVYTAHALYGEQYVYTLRPVITLIGFSLGLVGAFLYRRAGLPVAYLLAAVFGIPIVEIAISHLGRPVFMTRTVIWVAPLFFVLVAAAFSGLRPSRVLFAAGLIVALQLVGVKNYEQTMRKEPWRGTIQRVRAEACPGDVTILAPYYLLDSPFWYYFRHHVVPGRVIGAYTGNNESPDRRIDPIEFTNFSHLDETLLSFPRVWVFVDKSFAPEAADFIARLLSHHALSKSIVMRHTAVELFTVPGSSCSSPGDQARASPEHP
ncbi:MAG TPA: glycosyltransferase family 39 protein [Stellaceae bacterium]|nr:glycosyltransferase family 39 protein [Stellaceae bacterium]